MRDLFNPKSKGCPQWLKAGLLTFPVVVSVSGILWVGSMFVSGKCFNFFTWLVLPSIIFEGLFEKCCYAFSNNPIYNLLFAILFWVIAGAAIGYLYERIKSLLG
jgi:hypothetical protein